MHAPAVSQASPVMEYIASSPAVTPVSPVVEFLAPAPAVSESPAPVVEHLSLAPARFSHSVLRSPQAGGSASVPSVLEVTIMAPFVDTASQGRMGSARGGPPPVGPPGGDHRQPRAVYKYWARLTLCLRALVPGSYSFDAVLA